MSSASTRGTKNGWAKFKIKDTAIVAIIIINLINSSLTTIAALIKPIKLIANKSITIIKSVTKVIVFHGETKGGDPIPLRQTEVNRMLGKVDELSLQEESDIVIPFIHGENVKVIDGPFNGFDGTIEKINEEKRKLEVMVKIFGRKTPLELSYMQVEKL